MLQGQSWWSSHLWWLVASLYVLRPPAIMFSMSYYLQWCWIPSPWACMTVKVWPHNALQTSRGLPSSVTFFADWSLIFQFHCLVKTFLFQKLFHICKVWMSLLQKKKIQCSKTDGWQDATSGKFHAWPPATGCSQKADCTNNKEYRMKLPSGEVSEVQMKHKWTFCLDLETIHMISHIYVNIPQS